MLASVAATVAASLAAVFVGWPSPLEAPAEQLMEWTPVGAGSYLLLHADAIARPAAVLGAFALIMLLGGLSGALSGLLGRTSAGIVTATFVLLALYSTIFDSSWFAGPPLALAACYLVTSLLLSQRQPEVAGRREFLQDTATVLGGATALLALFWVEPFLHLAPARRFFAYLPPTGLPIAGLTPLVTAPQRFYIMDKVLQDPEVGPPEWRLSVDGRVAHPLSLDFARLMRYPVRHRYVTLECVDNPVGGPLISNALWSGVRVADLLRIAGPHGNTVLFRAADGYQESLPVGLLLETDALIAYAMNGEILPRAHGYPARLLVPGLYGLKSVKWLTGMQVALGQSGGEWAAHGWREMQVIHTTCRIDVARRLNRIVLVAGVAFAGRRGISAVEVRINGGAWQRAILGRALSRTSWVQWYLRLPTTVSGTVEARAVDGTGQVQSGARHASYPGGATGWATATV